MIWQQPLPLHFFQIHRSKLSQLFIGQTQGIFQVAFRAAVGVVHFIKEGLEVFCVHLRQGLKHFDLLFGNRLTAAGFAAAQLGYRNLIIVA